MNCKCRGDVNKCIVYSMIIRERILEKMLKL